MTEKDREQIQKLLDGIYPERPLVDYETAEAWVEAVWEMREKHVLSLESEVNRLKAALKEIEEQSNPECGCHYHARTAIERGPK